jgi:hypothetical protein
MPENAARYTIPITFEMTGTSREQAASVLHILLTRWSSTIRDVPVVSGDGRVSQPVRSWWFPEAALKHIDGNTHSDLVLREPDPLAEMFEGSPIPALLTEMFPPEPRVDKYLNADGTQDAEAFEDAHEQWRDRCLSIAVQAAHLADLIERLQRAERVRDGLIDLLERVPLPEEPQTQDYAVTVAPAYKGEIEDQRYDWDHRQWQADFAAASRQRDSAIIALLTDGGARTPFLPGRFHNDWLPADLLAVQTLRAVVTQEDGGGPPQRILDRDQRGELRAMLLSADPDIRIIDPDEPAGPALFRGPASEAALWIPYGVYPATGDNDQGAFRVVVGPAVGAPGQAASAAFPVGDHDTAVMNQIGHILATNPTGGTVALSRIAQLVASTGRDRGTIPPAQAETALERGGLLGDLLRQREQELGTPDRPGAHAPDSGSQRDPIR